MNLLLFIEHAKEYENLREKINKFLKLIKDNNSKLFIITEKRNKIVYMTDKNIVHIFYNTEKYYLNNLSQIIFFKYKQKLSIYNKFKRFVILYLSYLFISRNTNVGIVIYLNNSINLKKNFNFQIFKNFRPNDHMFGYLDRSIINYLDDPDICLVNLKHEKFKNFEKHILCMLNDTSFTQNLEFSIEYFATKVRYYCQNKYNIQNLNLIELIKNDLTKTNLNLLEFSMLSHYIEKDQKYIYNYHVIRNSKFNSFKKRGIDVNFIYKNLELEGLFNRNENILNLSEQPNYIDKTFPYIKTIHINSQNFLNIENDLNIDKIFVDNILFEYEKLKKIILKLKKYKKNIIFRRNLFLQNKIENSQNKEKIEGLLNSIFKKIKIIKNIKSDIYVIE